MQWLSPVLTAIQVISSLSIIVLVLLQQGKGADMGSSFGSGSAGSLFGATGAANFLSRTTKWAAIVFFASTGALAWVAHHPSGNGSLIDSGVMQGFQQSQEVPSTGTAVPTAPGAEVPSAPAAEAPASAAPDVPQAPAQAEQPAASAAPSTEQTAPAAEGAAAEQPAPADSK